jgi:hypothetical protein
MAMQPELRYTVGTILLVIVTMLIPGGRVLVLPAIFTLILVLLYWAAKPRDDK